MRWSSRGSTAAALRTSSRPTSTAVSSPYGQFRVYTRQSATYVEPIGEGCDVEGAYEALKHVFGVVGLSLARPCGKDKDAILACAKELSGRPAPRRPHL